MPGLFVTATGTDVGKTFIAAGLIRAGIRAGHAMNAFKPVMSGYREGDLDSDAGRLLGALGQPIASSSIAQLSPWRFAAPLSPNMAAAAEGRSIDYVTLACDSRAVVGREELTLVEGVGGVMVPLDEHHTVLDLMADLAIPILLVSGTGLGAISHCLTSLEALRARDLRPLLLVLNETGGSAVPLDETRATIARFARGVPIAVVRRDAGDDCFDALFGAIATRIGVPTI